MSTYKTQPEGIDGETLLLLRNWFYFSRTIIRPLPAVNMTTAI